MGCMTTTIIMKTVSTKEKFDLAQISDPYDELDFIDLNGEGVNIK